MLLVDTNAVLRLLLESHKLSRRAETFMAKATTSGGLAIAAVTLWEIAMLDAKGRVELDSPADAFLEEVESLFHVLPLTRQIAVLGNAFGGTYPNDPADRQIGATAVIHRLSLVTSDRKIRDSGEVPCIW